MFADLHEVLLERLRAARLGDPATVQQPLNARVGAERAQLQANAVFATGRAGQGGEIVEPVDAQFLGRIATIGLAVRGEGRQARCRAFARRQPWRRQRRPARDLTRDFFARQGVVDYRIVESSGATEGAPAAGTAEMIVDITTTGTTLAANALKIVDDGIILRSQANLVAARTAPWTPEQRETARVILDRITAQQRARSFREVRARFAACDARLVATARERFSVETPFGGPTSSGMLTLHCPPTQVYALTSFLRDNGAEAVAVADLDYVFSKENPLFSKLAAAL